MKLLREVLAGVKRLRDETPEDPNIAGSDIDRSNAEEMSDELSGIEDQPDDVNPDTDNDQLDSTVDAATDDPDRQGLIRTVKKAHLVYKRAADDGTYTELWLYNLQNLQQQTEIKRAILAGTDIPPNQTESPDGSQTYKIWSVGNAEMLEITGLPS